MPTKLKSPSADQPASFEARAVAVLQELRAAFLHLIEALPNPTHRAADLDKALGVSRTLGWQIHRVATCESPIEAGLQVPGMSAVQQVLRAARGQGVPEAIVRDVITAMDTFEAFVAQHAGDRTTFATMLNSLHGEDVEAIDVKARRQLFRAASQAWGVQLKTYLACQLIHPGKSSDTIDVASIRGLRGIRRLRSGAPFRLITQRYYDAKLKPVESHSIDEKNMHAPPGPKLLREFSTQPTPELDNRFDGRLMHTYLRDTPLGNAGALDLYIADISRDFEWKDPKEVGNTQRWFVAIRKPMETLVFDTLVHRSMFKSIDWETRICGSLDRLDEPDPDKFPPEETLPIKAEIRDLGLGPTALPSPFIPRYRDMVEHVCSEIGWNAGDFRVLRCVVEYPLLLSIVSLTLLLPDEGQW